MKKTLLCSVVLLAGLFMFSMGTSLEAREKHHRSHVRFGIGASCSRNYCDGYAVRRYVPVNPVLPVIVNRGPHHYCAPVYVYPAPVIEEVYIVKQPRPSLFTGFSFNWFFR